jgi:photoactive yellow protein
MMMQFGDKALLAALDAADRAALDALGFGVVRMDREGKVVAYNRSESELSGLSPERVIGRPFFTDVAPCTNNFMVAHRYEEAEALDETIDYVFTFRMRPTKVRLRLLKSPGAPHMYLLVERR